MTWRRFPHNQVRVETFARFNGGVYPVPLDI
jgi:hypothetical protein